MMCGCKVGEVNPATGNTYRVSAHHYIISRARSLKHRYNPKNGISLCYGCHIRKVHVEASYDATRTLVDSALTAGIITNDELEEIRESAGEITTLKREDLNELLDKLTLELKTIEA